MARVLTIINMVVVISLLIGRLREYAQAWRLFGFFPWSGMRQMLLFTRYTWRALLVYSGIVIAAAACLTFWLLNSLPNAIAREAGFLLGIIAFNFVLSDARPPAVVLLTSSSRTSADLFRRIRARIAPLRCVALLDYRRINRTQAIGIFSDNMRTYDHAVWKSIVHNLVKLSAAVIVDATPDSGFVAYEVFLMLEPARAVKTIFVVGDNGECPALKSHGIDPTRFVLRTATKSNVQDAAWRFLVDRMGDGQNGSEDEPQVIPETVDTLPPMLMIEMSLDFDSHWVGHLAASSDKQIVFLSMPFEVVDKILAHRIVTFHWEFAYDQRLMMGVFEQRSDSRVRVVLIRRTFLLDHVFALPRFRGRMPSEHHLPTFEELNAPLPQFAFVKALERATQEQGLICWHVPCGTNGAIKT